MDSPSWDATRIAVRDEILAAVRTQLEAGRGRPVVARWIASFQRALHVLDLQDDARQDALTMVRHRLARFLALTADDRPRSRLFGLKLTARWIESYLTRFRAEHPEATAQQWRDLLTPVWADALGVESPLPEKTIDEVRQAKTNKAAALKLLCNADPSEGTDDDLGRTLDRVDLTR